MNADYLAVYYYYSLSIVDCNRSIPADELLFDLFYSFSITIYLFIYNQISNHMIILILYHNSPLLLLFLIYSLSILFPHLLTHLLNSNPLLNTQQLLLPQLIYKPTLNLDQPHSIVINPLIHFIKPISISINHYLPLLTPSLILD